MKLILGSGSQSRQDILREAGYTFEVFTADINEKEIRDKDPKKLVLALAHEKARAILPKIKEPSLLITADQVAVCDGVIMEKPTNEQEAREFIRRYNDHPMETVSSIVITDTTTRDFVEGIDIAKVYFKGITEDAIDEALKEGRVMYCAGAMRCEDPPLSRFVERFDGTRDSTSGLPLKLLKRLLEEI